MDFSVSKISHSSGQLGSHLSPPRSAPLTEQAGGILIMFSNPGTGSDPENTENNIFFNKRLKSSEQKICLRSQSNSGLQTLIHPPIHSFIHSANVH